MVQGVSHTVTAMDMVTVILLLATVHVMMVTMGNTAGLVREREAKERERKKKGREKESGKGRHTYKKDKGTKDN